MTLAVHKWKPVTPEFFTTVLHKFATYCGDFHGNGGVSVKAHRLTRTDNATIYYHPKVPLSVDGVESLPGVSTPFLMTMNSRNGKLLCFEYIGDGGDGVPEHPVDVVHVLGDLDHDALNAALASVAPSVASSVRESLRPKR